MALGRKRMEKNLVLKFKKVFLKRKKKNENKLKISFSLSYNVPIERNMLSNIEEKILEIFLRFSNQKEMKRKKHLMNLMNHN